MFGLFCEYGTHEILVLIPEISWIPSFASCEQVAAVGDELEVKIIHIDRERNKIAGSLRGLHPESDPWHGAWQLGVGDVLDATVVRWVEKADRCGDAGGYLLALRPAALVMLCGQEAGRFKSGDRVAVRVTAIDARQGKVTVAAGALTGGPRVNSPPGGRQPRYPEPPPGPRCQRDVRQQHRHIGDDCDEVS